MVFVQKFTVTIVGLDLKDIVLSAAKEAGLFINPVNRVNHGMFGNFRTLTYIFDIDDDKLIKKRRDFMNILGDERRYLIPMWEHGDWNQVYILRRWAFIDED